MSAKRLSLAVTTACVLACLPSAGQTPPRSGEQILRSTCQTCHSLRPNQVKVGPSLYGVLNGPKPRYTRAQVATLVTFGIRKMPALGIILTAEDISHLSDALKALPR